MAFRILRAQTVMYGTVEIGSFVDVKKVASMGTGMLCEDGQLLIGDCGATLFVSDNGVVRFTSVMNEAHTKQFIWAVKKHITRLRAGNTWRNNKFMVDCKVQTNVIDAFVDIEELCSNNEKYSPVLDGDVIQKASAEVDGVQVDVSVTSITTYDWHAKKDPSIVWKVIQDIICANAI